jgi:hypothetical protein
MLGNFREEKMILHLINQPKLIMQEGLDEWTLNLDIDQLPYEQARVFSNIIYHTDFKQIELNIRNRIIGKTKFNWTNNQSRMFRILNDLPQEMQTSKLMMWKGAAVAEISNHWRTREMGDLDVQVRPEDLEQTLFHLRESNNWKPMGRVTWANLLPRAIPRRESWNFISRSGDILDIHWSYLDGNNKNNMLKDVFQSSKLIKVFDFDLLLPTVEWVLASSLQHGFLKGTRGDKVQSIFDFYHLYKLCNTNELRRTMRVSGIESEGNLLRNLIGDGNPNALKSLLSDEIFHYTNPPWLRNMSRGKLKRFNIRYKSIIPKNQMDYRMLNNYFIYRMWEILGRSSTVENIIFRYLGFFTKGIELIPLEIEDILTIGWQLPDGKEIWSDRADCRMKLDLTNKSCTSLKIKLSENFKISPNPIGFIYINGVYSGAYNLKEDLTRDFLEVAIPEKLRNTEIEISFRPDPYVSRKEIKLRNNWQRQSIPISIGSISDVIEFI